MSKTKIQASDLKENLENQEITCNNSTIVFTDAEEFCTSASLKLVKKKLSACHFSKHLSEEDHTNNKHHLNWTKFGMQSMLFAFSDKCCD